MNKGFVGPELLANLPWGTLAAMFAFALAFAWFKKVGWPMLAGRLGEAKVRRMNVELPVGEYTDVGEVTLALQDGTTTQIDHVVVSRFGVFVIETKMYDGWIFGSAKSKKWTQQLYNKKSQFQNPIRQNWRHVKALEETLGLPEKVFRSVVVFIGGAEFKTDMPEGVYKGSAYLHYIRSFKTEVLTPEAVSRAVAQLRRLQQRAPSSREHLKNLKARHATPRPKPESVVQARSAGIKRGVEHFCPKCGSKMAVRTNRQSGEKFFGCTAYPKCRGTAPYNE